MHLQQSSIEEDYIEFIIMQKTTNPILSQLGLSFQVCYHYIHQLLQTYPRRPTPVLPRIRIVNTVRPRISNLLSLIGLVVNLQRHCLVDAGSQFLDCKTERSHIIAGSYFHLLSRGLHDLNSPPYSVIHIDHWERSVLLHKASIGTVFESSMENSNGIVSSSSSREFLPTNDARVPHTSHIQTILLEVILTQQFPSILGDAVHGCWFDDCVLRSGFFRGVGSKNCH